MLTGPLAFTGLALFSWPVRDPRVAAAARLRAALGDRADPRPGRVARHRSFDRRRLAAGLVALVVIALLGVPVGIVAAAPAAIVADRLLRRAESGVGRRDRLARASALPGALDLLAVALRAGLPVASAIELVADSIGDPLAGELRHVGSLTSLGADARSAWTRYATDPVWGGVARAVGRASESGSALADTFERVADDRRAERGAQAESAAHRAAVLAMAPLGLCFLPAFVCLGVVPVVIGLLSGVLR